ncbi:hypothetical protein BKA93DRAFT_734722 [Sparassis latifolia]
MTSKCYCLYVEKYDSQDIRLPSKLFRATQSVKLSGLGSPTFAEAVKGVIAIHQLFAEHLAKGMLIPWSLIREHDELVLEFSNRYLSFMRDMEDDNEIPIGNDIDPFGILTSRIRDEKYLTNNVVQYFERITRLSGETRTQMLTVMHSIVVIKPSVIQEGQLVELQVTFCTVPISKGRMLMLSKLQSICILDRQVLSVRRSNADVPIFQDHNPVIMNSLVTPVLPVRRVKRKIGYDEDDSTIGGIKRLHLDTENREKNMDTNSE